jgi:cation-transporting ATPase I
MDMSRFMLRCATLGLEAADAGLQAAGAGLGAAGAGMHATAAIGAASVRAAGAGASAVVSGGIGLATMPLQLGAGLLSGIRSVESVPAVAREFVGGTPSRRCWRGGGRAWVEVRGLTGPQGREVGAAVLAAARAHPDIRSADLNYPLSRLVVSVPDSGPALHDLCDLVDGAEDRGGRAGVRVGRQPPPDLPGDGVILAGRLAALTASGVGLCTAVAGRALGWPRLPGVFSAAVTVIDYQPRLRRLIEDRLGPVAADTVIGLAAAAAYTVTLAPASLMVDLGILLALGARTGRAFGLPRERGAATTAATTAAGSGGTPR